MKSLKQPLVNSNLIVQKDKNVNLSLKSSKRYINYLITFAFLVVFYLMFIVFKENAQ